MKKIQQVRKLIEATNGNFFSVEFQKKDGSLREMTCRTNVTKYLKGGVSGTANYEQYVTVFDVQKNAYRNINAETIRRFKCGEMSISFQ